MAAMSHRAPPPLLSFDTEIPSTNAGLTVFPHLPRNLGTP